VKIAIIGAGILGRALAVTLFDRCHSVSLFERSSQLSETSCTATAAGMLCPWSEIFQSTDLVFQLGLRSLALWPKFLSYLSASSLFLKQGTCHIFPKQDAFECKDYLKFLLQKDPSLKIEQDYNLQDFLSSAYKVGFFLPAEASIDPREFILASNEYFAKNLVPFYQNTKVTKINSKQLLAGFDCVVDTRGLDARDELPELRGVRGELILVHVPHLELSNILQVHHGRYPIYIVPRDKNRFIIGATSVEAEHRDPISVASCLELLSVASSVNPAFLEGFVEAARVNLRPTFFDASPKMIKKNGVYFINGLYRHGILLSPAIAEIFADHLEGKSSLMECEDA